MKVNVSDIELDFGPNTLGTKHIWKNPKQIEQSYQIIFRLAQNEVESLENIFGFKVSCFLKMKIRNLF